MSSDEVIVSVTEAKPAGSPLRSNKGSAYDKWARGLADRIGWTVESYGTNTDAVQAVVTGKVLGRRETLQGTVGPEVVVQMLEAVDQQVQLGERGRQVVDRVELVTPAAVGPLHRAVQLR